MVRKEFSNIKLLEILFNYEACMVSSPCKEKGVVHWSPPLSSMLNNVDSIARGEPSPAGVGGVLHNDKGVVLPMLSKHIGVKDSN